MGYKTISRIFEILKILEILRFFNILFFLQKNPSNFKIFKKTEYMY